MPELRAAAHTARQEAGRRYRLLLDLARDVTAQRELPDVLVSGFDAIRQVLEFTGGSIALVDEDHFLGFAATDPPATAEALTARIPVGQGIAGGIAATGEPVYIADITADERVTPERRQKSTSGGVRSYFGVPLVAEGAIIGVLQIDSTEVDAFDEEDRLLLLSFTPIVAAAVQNARLYARETAAVARLRELDERHQDFVAVVSHELRTPLTAMLGYSDTIVQHYDQLGLEAIRDIAMRARTAATRLAELVEELLDLSVIQRGELRLRFAPTDIAPLLDDVMHEFAPPGREVKLDVADDLPRALIDARRLHQVVGNLVSNAVKFSTEESPLCVRAFVEDDKLVIEVGDQGVGIAVEDIDRIFDRFVQVERANVRHIGGFGIGLYVVRQLCDAMGAEIEVDSAPGAGSTFRLRTPLAPPLAVRALQN